VDHERDRVPVGPELVAELAEVFDAAPRLSPAARRFMAGEMDPGEARRLGYLPDVES
jgi:hypothetical protein